MSECESGKEIAEIVNANNTDNDVLHTVDESTQSPQKTWIMASITETTVR